MFDGQGFKTSAVITLRVNTLLVSENTKYIRGEYERELRNGTIKRETIGMGHGCKS